MLGRMLRPFKSPFLVAFLILLPFVPVSAETSATQQRLLEQAEKGNVTAQYRLGFRYENGYGAPVDLAKALKWYRAAAEQGNPQAQGKLGRMYADGRGAPQNYAEAYVWLSVAAKAWPDPVAAIALKRERDAVAGKLGSAELADARRIAERWLKSFEEQKEEDNDTAAGKPAPPANRLDARKPEIESLDEGRYARVLRVGPSRALKKPSDAAAVARPGDLINIDAGEYEDCAVWRTKNIAIQGVGGYAHVRDATCEGKAIWVFYAAPVVVNGIRFSGARVPNNNGAGIRWEGNGTLVVKGSWFHNNQMGILTHNVLKSSLVVEKSRFVSNGDCPRFCGHGVYAGRIWRLSISGSEFLAHNYGHHIKSRAYYSDISGNRISDGAKGTASFAINLPDSGTARIRYNFIEKGPRAENVKAMISIGEEGQKKGGVMNPSRGILIELNTFQNDNPHPTIYVWNRGRHPVSLRSNIFGGKGIRYRGFGG